MTGHFKPNLLRKYSGEETSCCMVPSTLRMGTDAKLPCFFPHVIIMVDHVYIMYIHACGQYTIGQSKKAENTACIQNTVFWWHTDITLVSYMLDAAIKRSQCI